MHHRKSFIIVATLAQLWLVSCHEPSLSVSLVLFIFILILTLLLPSDPDIEHLPFLAISPVFFNSLWSSYYKRSMLFDRFSAFLVSLQHKVFYTILAFGRFNLYAESYGFLVRKAFDTRKAKGGRWSWWLEVIGIVFFWCWFGALLKGCGSWTNALIYLIVSHVVTSPLHVQVRRAANKIARHSRPP